MPIPQTRRQLVDQIETAFKKLDAELRDVDNEIAAKPCVDDWSVKDLLAVRLWWTRSVLDWIDKGQKGLAPITPAPGYRWNETRQYQTARTYIRKAKREADDNV